MTLHQLIGLFFISLAFATSVKAQSEPCTGSQFTTDAQFFRAKGSAISSDVTASKKKAAGNARTELTHQMNIKIESAAKTQANITGLDKTKLVELIQVVIRQETMNVRVICENTNEAGGKFQTSVVIELSKATLLSNIVQQVKGDSNLKANFDEGKFKGAF